MNIAQLIHDLSMLQSQLEPDTEVRTWFVGRQPPQPLDVHQTAGVATGWDAIAQKPLIYIRTKP